MEERHAFRFTLISTTFSSTNPKCSKTPARIVNCEFPNAIANGFTNALVRRWAALPLPSQPIPKSSKALVDLFSEIKFTVGQENEIVQAVFPHPILVMGVFLQRVFAQSVSVMDITSLF